MPKKPSRDRVNPDTIDTTPIRRPDWIKVRAPSGETFTQSKINDASKVSPHSVRRSKLSQHG